MSAFTGYGLGFGVKVPNTSEVLRRANEAREGETYAVDDSVKNQLVCNPAIRWCAWIRACVYVHVCVCVCMCVYMCVCVCFNLMSPPYRTMMIGANKDGWWDEVKLMQQSEDLLDFLESWDKEDKYQFVGHFDQSVAHNKKNSHALVSCAFVHIHILV